MADYDFSTLNATDLEDLVCDLLNLEQPISSGVTYRTFKEGKDKGIDFLYSTNSNDYEHVGQVKHYYKTGYEGMLFTLKKSEKQKVLALNPGKYIFVTSVDLSVSNAIDIQQVFHPYLNNLADIYGKKDLNRLIQKHDSVILKSHYKLWLSSISIFNSILNSGLEFRSSAFVEHELKKRLRLYVKTPLFEEARKALNKNKFIIITGEPGVGKTTMAEMLVYEYIAEEYKLTYILDDIKEAETALLPDISKQIIYFDDFLGSNVVEINKAKGSETALRKILRRISTAENKLIIFTTRTFLLNTAIDESENLRKFNIKAKSSLFKLEEYDSKLKKQLLENHVEESEIREELKSVLKEARIVDFITKHPNFSPRSVEFITAVENVNDLQAEEFEKYIVENFNLPSEIWRHAYTEQIAEDDRLLLNTLLSFGLYAKREELEIAFLKRLEYEVKTNNRTKQMYAFQKAFIRLEGGFIIMKSQEEVHFINPSLVDFLFNYLSNDRDEVIRIAESVAYINQLTARIYNYASKKEIQIPFELKRRLLLNYESFVRKEHRDYDLIQIALVIYKFIDKKDSEKAIISIINDIDSWETLHSDYSLNTHFKEFMISSKENPRIFLAIENRILEIVTELFTGELEIFEAIDMLERSFNDFDMSSQILDTPDIKSHLDDLFTDYISQEIDWLEEFISDESEAHEKELEIMSLANRVSVLGINYEPNMEDFKRDWYSVVLNNEFKRIMEKDD